MQLRGRGGRTHGAARGHDGHEARERDLAPRLRHLPQVVPGVVNTVGGPVVYFGSIIPNHIGIYIWQTLLVLRSLPLCLASEGSTPAGMGR